MKRTSTSRSGRRPGTLRPSGIAGMVWGGLLLWRGRQLFDAVERRQPSGGERDAVVLLGTRHLAQGVVQLVAPRHFARLYAGIDGLHAASMVVLAVRERDRRRAALLSAGVAAVSGWLALRASGSR